MKKQSSSFITAILCAVCALLTVFSEPAANAASASLDVCLKSLIPSLFPYMVASSMLVSCGAAEQLGNIIPAAKIFGINGKASGAIILGALCGFPLGAKISVDLYKKGIVSKTEAEALISVANNTGPSFVVAVIGAGFWGSAAFGWKLYLFQIVSALIAGIIVNRLILPLPKSRCRELPDNPSEGFSVIFIRAVTESVGAVLSVCGFVMLFAVICGYVRIAARGLTPLLSGAVFSGMELTGATQYAAELASTGDLLHGGFFTGFALGFSGLSVFCQAAAFTAPLSLSLRRTYAVKSIQGVLCGIFAAIAASGESAVLLKDTSAVALSLLPAAVAASVFAIVALKNMLKA